MTATRTSDLIAVFGGTFDPVHYGHLRSAYELAEVLSCDDLRFLPCRNPALKSPATATDGQRLAMLEAAVAGYPQFSVDDRELHRDGPSYTVDTLEELRGLQRAAPLCLIVGMDAWADFARWHRWQDILGLAHIVVAKRPGAAAPGNLHDDVMQIAEEVTNPADLHNSPAGCIYVHEVTQLEISSSEIRAMLQQGIAPDFLLPPAVAALIESSGCYKT